RAISRSTRTPRSSSWSAGLSSARRRSPGPAACRPGRPCLGLDPAVTGRRRSVRGDCRPGLNGDTKSRMIAVPSPAQPAAAGGDTAARPAIHVAGLTKRYGDVVAVDDIELTVRPGEFFTMLGPSGSGKTTLLRLIAGFERPDRGRIELGGRDVTGVPP